MRHILVCVPGLGDRKWFFTYVMRNWQNRHHIHTIVHLMPWLGTDQMFQPKIDRLLARIDEYHSEGYKVSLLGASAGGSAVINAYCARKTQIHRVINVCGRMKKGAHVFPSLDLAAFRSPSFYQSVTTCESNLLQLSTEDNKKIFILRPFFDEIVPRSTTDVKQLITMNLPSIGHGLSIALAMTVFSKRIVDFILED